MSDFIGKAIALWRRWRRPRSYAGFSIVYSDQLPPGVVEVRASGERYMVETRDGGTYVFRKGDLA